MNLLDGKALSEKIRLEVKNESILCQKNGVTPCLAVILVGDDGASQTYVNAKAKGCAEANIKSLVYRLDKNTTQSELLALINTLNYDDSVHGILVQLPLPPHINKDLILEAIAVRKDVDGFHPMNVGYLSLNQNCGFVPCTPLGIMTLLNEYKINLEGLDVVVVGASNIVGKPMATLLLNAEASVSVCHIKTKNLSEYTKKADLIIVAAGCPNLIKADMVKDGVIIVDVGITRVSDESAPKGYKIVGDVDFNEVSKKAKLITPVPGGVGPMTIAMLLSNTIKSAKLNLGK